MVTYKRYAGWIFLLIAIAVLNFEPDAMGQQPQKKFAVIAFYTAKEDAAHISFVHEANRWFQKMSREHHFQYDSTDDWSKLNDTALSRYDVVIFFDTRPERASQRTAFQKYMDNGGAWMGFHFAAFALTPSKYPQDWDWYHNVFIGAGSYKSNTWRPTSAILKVEHPEHPVAKGIPGIFRSAPNEWYRWERDLKTNPDIEILLSIDSSSFPLGTGPKPHEIWHSGYYPVVWTNRHYRMVYFNMGHNDIDYENKTNRELSFQFDNAVESRLILNGLLWLLRDKGAASPQ